VTDHPNREDYRIYRSRLGRTSSDWSTSTELVTPATADGFGPPEPFDAVERWPDWRPDLQVWSGTPGHDGS
jgi:hypothetical protein